MEGERIFLDSAIIVDGKFTLKGAVEEPVYCHLIVPEINPETGKTSNIFDAPLILENAKIKLTADAEGKSKVTGTENNEILQTYMDADAVLGQKQDDALQAARDAKAAGDGELAESFGEEQQKYSKERRELRIEFVKNNINNPAGRSQFFHNKLGSLLGLPLEQLKELIADANEATLQNPLLLRVAERIQALEKTAIGQYFTDIRMPNVNGKEIALSDYAGKGKYVLLDFWATWCSPCRAEMPHVLAVYKKYKNKGFEVVGVSLDAKHDAWLKGIKDLGLTWPQMSDLKGWSCEGAKLYAVHGIPHTVLIDPNGIIIAHNLRGKKLEEKLAELIK